MRPLGLVFDPRSQTVFSVLAPDLLKNGVRVGMQLTVMNGVRCGDDVLERVNAAPLPLRLTFEHVRGRDV